MNIERLKQNLVESEGLRLKVYKDTVGKMTIGVGRNLDDLGISEQEADFLLHNDVMRLEQELKPIDTFMKLIEPRQHVIAEMTFNLGLAGIKKFVRMWEALKIEDWETAADEMLDSLWSQQVGQRAVKLANRMRTGQEA